MNDFDIDEWEDMLPVEREYEKQHSFSGGGHKVGIGGVIIWLLVMIYIIVDASASSLCGVSGAQSP